MKRISNYLLVIAFSLAILGCNSAKKIEELDSRDSLYYVKGTQDLYTGPIADFYGNNQKKYEGEVKDGKITGPYKEYYESGNRKAERTFENGMEKEGSIEWLENGSEKLGDNDAIEILSKQIEMLEGSITISETSKLNAYDGASWEPYMLERLSNIQKDLKLKGIITSKVSPVYGNKNGYSQIVNYLYTAQLTDAARALVLKKQIGPYNVLYEVNCGEFVFDELIGVFQNEQKSAEVEYFVKFKPSMFFEFSRERDRSFDDRSISDGARFKRKVTIRKYEGKGWKISE